MDRIMTKGEYYKWLNEEIAKEVGAVTADIISFIRSQPIKDIADFTVWLRNKASKSPKMIYQDTLAFIKSAPTQTLKHIMFDFDNYNNYLKKNGAEK